MAKQQYLAPALVLDLLVTAWFLLIPQGSSKAFAAEIDALRAEYGFPGVAAVYVRIECTSGVGATGFADVEAAVLMTPDSHMLAASVAKTFVGAKTVALAQEGLLNLDEAVSPWLGERECIFRLPNHDSISLRRSG